jgi:hypothetical protein
MFTCFVAASCQLCGMWRYELIKMVLSNDTCIKDFQLYGKGPHRYCRLVRGSYVETTSSVRHELNYCGFCPPVADPCRKGNCTLNLSIGTLQLSRAPQVVNVISVFVLLYSFSLSPSTKEKHQSITNTNEHTINYFLIKV